MAARKENPPGVDELYGLEPVIEPGDGEAARADTGGVQPQAVQCPFCGEVFDTMVDLSAGSTSYIEDCQICCQPIEFRLEAAEDGTLAGLQLGRGD